MLFNSFDFLLFFPVVVAMYFALPYRFRWGFLLAASYYFYACWKAEYLILIMASTLIDYWAGLKMGNIEVKAQRRPYLILSLCSNLGILFSFKYFNFFNDSARAIFQQFNIFYDVPAFDVLLPVGISFYTFQTLAYAIDVYRGKVAAERHLGIFALYVSFFPQLVAGPIERSQRLLPQFREKFDFDYQRVVDGFKLMTWGFFQKLVIADRLAIYVSEVYSNPDVHSGWPILIATYLFAIQVYCDFAGYSDIAIGAAKVMGYDLMENFRRPFLAKNISGLWNRWHISLTTWFKDYLFAPLALRRGVSKNFRLFSLFLVFLLCGLWHGANWTFVIFGALHGIYLVMGNLTSSLRRQLWERWHQTIENTMPGNIAGYSLKRISQYFQNGLARFITFNLFAFTGIFFGASSLENAMAILVNIIRINANTPIITGLTSFDFYFVIEMSIFLMLIHWLEEQKGKHITQLLTDKVSIIRWVCYISILFITIVGGEFGAREFIYFQF